MNNNKWLGLTKVALTLTAIFSINANANQELTLDALPVITEDCGASVCADRRTINVENVSQFLADAQGKAQAANQANKTNSSSNKKNGKGLAIGQNNNDTQVVFLNFEQSSPVFEAVAYNGLETFVSHQYTQAERDEIQRRIAADYEGFDIEFTQSRPESGEYSTLNFECQNDGVPCIDFGGGILFGRAQSIDIGNVIRDDVAFVDANLWQVFAQFDPTGLYLSYFSGIEIVDGDVDAALSEAIVNQASNTGAHELGHNLGLRHHDSFGAPGTGLPTTGTPSNDAFFPVFDGPRNGEEAILHTMASGASVGSGLTDSTARDRFFSERSVIKLASNQRGRLVNEGNLSNGKRKVKLHNVVAPNTILEGQNADGKLDINEAIIIGRIDQNNEVDSYRFTAKAGDFVSAEFNGFDIAIGEPVIGAVQLFRVENNGELSLVAQNFQNFEGFDALLVDAPIETSGDYVLQVSAPNILSFGIGADGNPILFPLEETGNGALRTGDYRLSIYSVTGKTGNGPGHVPGA